MTDNKKSDSQKHTAKEVAKTMADSAILNADAAGAMEPFGVIVGAVVGGAVSGAELLEEDREKNAKPKAKRK